MGVEFEAEVCEIAAHLAAGAERHGRRLAGKQKPPGQKNVKSASSRSRSVNAEDLRQDNAKLAATLSKVRGLVLLLQRQTNEAEEIRDKERQEYQRLEASAQQLQRDLNHAASKEDLLKHALTTATKSRGNKIDAGLPDKIADCMPVSARSEKNRDVDPCLISPRFTLDR